MRRQCAKCPWRIDVDPNDIPNGYCVKKHAALKETIATPGRLLARNVRIVRDSARVLGYLEPFRKFTRRGGGTAFAFRIARYFNVPVFNVSSSAIRDAFDGAAINGPIFP